MSATIAPSISKMREGVALVEPYITELGKMGLSTHRYAIVASTTIATNGAVIRAAVLAPTTRDWISSPSWTLLPSKAPSPGKTKRGVTGRGWRSGAKWAIVSGVAPPSWSGTGSTFSVISWRGFKAIVNRSPLGQVIERSRRAGVLG